MKLTTRINPAATVIARGVPSMWVETMVGAELGDGEGDGPGLFAETSDCTKTYISPVLSELIQRRPVLSQARPTGRKHLDGQASVFGLLRMSVVELVLFRGASGWPSLNSSFESLYPTGLSRFPALSTKVTD